MFSVVVLAKPQDYKVVFSKLVMAQECLYYDFCVFLSQPHLLRDKMQSVDWGEFLRRCQRKDAVVKKSLM